MFADKLRDVVSELSHKRTRMQILLRREVHLRVYCEVWERLKKSQVAIAWK